MAKDNLKIVKEVYDKYASENPYPIYSYFSFENYISDACKKIKWMLSNTDIDADSEYYINVEKYIREFAEAERYLAKVEYSKQVASRLRNEAIQKEDKIFQEKIKSLNK